MNADKQKALEAAGWKFGSVDEFLGERPMSDSDKMRAEFEAWATSEDFKVSKYEDAAHVYCEPETHDCWIAWQSAYAAGRKAEQETIRKLISPEVVAPLIKLSELVDGALKRSKPKGDQ